MSKDVDLKAIGPTLRSTSKSLSTYAGLLFFVLVACVYAFLLIRINTLNTQPADSDTVQASTKKLHVDEDVVKQLQKLQDNSVNVQSLFDNARNNPFQE